jgi:hypothetical protein
MPSEFSSSPKQRAVWAVLATAYPALLSVDELAREVEDRIATEDGIAAFERLGLVHRFGEFVWLTRTAIAAEHVES